MITKCYVQVFRYRRVCHNTKYSFNSVVSIKWLHSAGSSLSQANSSKTSQSSLTSSGFLYYEDPHRYNGSDVSANASETTTTSTAKPAIHSATPYSDKYYQPIISQEEDKESPIQQDQLQEIVNSFDAPIDVSIGYGSGILPQDGYDKDKSTSNNTANDSKQLDFMFLVKDCGKFHQENLKQNRDHYSIKSLRLIKKVQGTNGMYFNPFIKINEKLVKYGVISSKSALMDLSEWHSLYFAGRLQKPVNFITTNDPRVKFLNQYNLKNAMTIAIFLIDGEGNSRQATFNERQLYEQITKLSYLGDFRMYIGGENPNKSKNIVAKQFHHFKKLYEPILQYFIHKNFLIIVDNDPVNRTFKPNLNVNNRIKLITGLPLKFRQQLYGRYYEKSIKEIVIDDHLSQNLTKIISRTIIISSITQAIRGLLSAGLFNSIKYAVAKQIKFWTSKK
ncbi:Mitochondrial matrix Mmp37 family protein [Candida albicans]|uniref:Phosphatidate cytidylyltransferase, mitochondrial n=1 Tax=Candida albicans TaxID=5476 RepID=A0A8H6BRB9_CANAX|nr:Mitochondrial matrix Mmp37 family protein [Candida albicans]